MQLLLLIQIVMIFFVILILLIPNVMGVVKSTLNTFFSSESTQVEQHLIVK